MSVLKIEREWCCRDRGSKLCCFHVWIFGYHLFGRKDGEFYLQKPVSWRSIYGKERCDHPGCKAAGSVKCELGGIYSEDIKTFYPDTVEYFCPEHAGENGFCHCCGRFIDGLEVSLFGTLCESCHEQINPEDDDED